MDGVKLTFEDGALEKIVEIASEKKTGARGLRAVLESALIPIMYELPSKKGVCEVIITKETVVDKAQPKYIEKMSESA
jgi:ATP-dependent Clp protease ATP-binding subunit ClpX